MRPPSVDVLARALAGHPDSAGLPHPLLVDAARAAIAAGGDDLVATARGLAVERRRRLLQPVVNATGVLLHTNLGRAPLATHADPAGARPVRSSNVELDLASGRRGSRREHAAALLARLSGAEAALVVNNCAAAVLLVLATLARGRAVLVSRGELVEIGGGFRIPEVLEQSGATLVEVGTTNRTRLEDYRRAIAARPDGEVALVLKVHRSNYRITGFTEEVDVAALATLGLPVVADTGSGLLDTATPWLVGDDGTVLHPAWLAGEPAAKQTLAAGAAVVTYSGDKLLGGPQAGVIAGRADLVAACASHPLARAVRPGALVLEALQDTALAYLRNEAATAIPFWRMASLALDGLEHRARSVAAAVGAPASVVATEAVAGGGTLPGVTMASVGVAVPGDAAAALRAGTPPVLARVDEGRTVCDLRTVDPLDDDLLAAALRATLTR